MNDALVACTGFHATGTVACLGSDARHDLPNTFLTGG